MPRSYTMRYKLMHCCQKLQYGQTFHTRKLRRKRIFGPEWQSQLIKNKPSDSFKQEIELQTPTSKIHVIVTQT